MNKQYFLTFILTCTFNFLLNAQAEDIRKNSILIYYSPTVSKANLFDENSSWLSDFFYKTQTPSRFLKGYQFGGQYLRLLSDEFSIYIGYRFTLKGQETPHYFNTFGNDPEDAPENYGGGAWDVRLTTDEFILGIEQQLLKNKKGNLSFWLKPGLSMDVYRNMIVRDYIIEKDTGVKRDGCCSLGRKLPSNEWFGNLKENVRSKHFRIGFILAAPLKVDLINNLIRLHIVPEVEYLTKLINTGTDIHGVLQGNIFSAGLQFGLDINF